MDYLTSIDYRPQDDGERVLLRPVASPVEDIHSTMNGYSSNQEGAASHSFLQPVWPAPGQDSRPRECSVRELVAGRQVRLRLEAWVNLLHEKTDCRQGEVTGYC